MRHNEQKNTLATYFIRPKKGASACVALLLAGSLAQADAFRIPYQGAAAAGQGEAFAAQADDASALYYNPAGLARLSGVHVSAGMSFVGGGTDFTSPAGQTYHSDYGGDFAFPAPSNYYLVGNMGGLDVDALKPLTVGIGLDSPYGLITRWNGDTPFSSLVTRARLPMLDIKPTMAYAFNDMLSLGFGLDIYTFAGFIGAGEYELRNTVPGLGSTELNGHGTSVGYNASLLFTPLRNGKGKPLLNLGFVYRSGGQLDLRGDYQANGKTLAKARSALTLPDIFTFAAAGWPVRDRYHEWKLEYDMEYVDWSAAQNLNINLSNGQHFSIPQHWHTVYTASVGTEFKWLDPGFLPNWDIGLRAGFQHANSPVPDDTLNPQLPDSNYNAVALGLGFNCRDKGRLYGLIECGNDDKKPFTAKSLGLDFAFQALMYDPRRIAGNIQPSVDGHYKTTIFVGSVNFNLSY